MLSSGGVSDSACSSTVLYIYILTGEDVQSSVYKVVYIVYIGEDYDAMVTTKIMDSPVCCLHMWGGQ